MGNTSAYGRSVEQIAIIINPDANSVTKPSNCHSLSEFPDWTHSLLFYSGDMMDLIEGGRHKFRIILNGDKEINDDGVWRQMVRNAHGDLDSFRRCAADAKTSR